MDANQMIDAFISVASTQDYVFNQVAVTDISVLLDLLASLSLESTTAENFADILRQWYINYPDVRDAVLMEEREIDRVRRSNPVSQENTLENRYRLTEAQLNKIKENKDNQNG